MRRIWLRRIELLNPIEREMERLSLHNEEWKVDAHISDLVRGHKQASATDLELGEPF